MDDFFLEMQEKGLIEFKKPTTVYELFFSGTKKFVAKIEPTDTNYITNFDAEIQFSGGQLKDKMIERRN